MRADRLLSLLMLLQARGKLSARLLARELEVSERTIYRDIEALGMAGIPVYGEPGREGGYALVDSYRTSLTGLSEGEVRALFMLSIPAPLAELGLSQPLKAALLKLSAALPAARRQDEALVRQRFYLDSTWWERDEGAVPHLHLLQQAIWEDRKVQLHYHPPFALEIVRVVAPYGLVAKGGAWYLVYAIHERVAARRIAELLDVRLTAETFARPADFDLAAFWQAWCAERQEERGRYAVRVRVAPEMLPEVLRRFGERVREQLAATSSPDAQDWQPLTLSFDSFEQARGWILGLGGAIEVLTPLPLRLSVADFVRQTAGLYEAVNSKALLANCT